MARHASGKNNFRLAGWVIALLVALALAVALIWYLAQRDGGSDSNAATEPECVAGELTLPIAASDTQVGQQLIDAYRDTHPVVRDYCVKPQLVDSVSAAAVYVAPNTTVSHTELDNAGRTAAVADPQAVFSEPAGVASKNGVKLEDLKIASVRFPVEEESAASALVARKVAGDDNAAVKALTDQRISTLADFNAGGGDAVATVEDNVPSGLQFTPVGSDVVYAAIPLNQTEKVNEDQSRAGQDFARHSAEQFDGSANDQPVISDLVWAAALPGGGEGLTGDAGKRNAQAQSSAQTTAPVAQVQPENTLFLLDTSDAMAPYIESAKEAIADAALALGADGKEVGLWNYSSPLNPGVVVGYRQNLTASPDAESVAVAVRRFLTGGVPQTREAVEAAAGAYGGAATTTRIVLVTTGTADAGDDKAFADAVRKAAGDTVHLTVVRVGEGEPDAAVSGLAQKAVDAKQADAIPAAVREAAGL